MLTRLRNYASALAHKYSIGQTASDKKSSAPSRPMKFPYTYSAKIAQFPYKFYRANNWVWRYYVYAVLGSLPVFIYINGLANTPSNKALWAEIRRKEAEEHHH